MTKQLFNVDLALEHSTPQFALGELYIDRLGNHYRYMLASGAKTAYLCYVFDHDVWTVSSALTTTVAAAGEVHPVCCPQLAITDAYYAWVFVGPGRATFTSASAIVAESKISTSATAGKLDDASAGRLVPGLVAYDAFASAVTGTCLATIPLYVTGLDN